MTGDRVRVARIYDPPTGGDDYRALVDRIWPRGVRKDDARLDEWCKAVAPSTELRKWYGHDPARFTEFRRRYLRELGDADRQSALRHLRGIAARRRLTLLTATKDVDISAATVLADVLTGHPLHGGVAGEF